MGLCVGHKICCLNLKDDSDVYTYDILVHNGPIRHVIQDTESSSDSSDK